MSPVATEQAEGRVDWEKAVASVTRPTRRKARKFFADERIACVIAGRTSERALSQTPGLWGRCRSLVWSPGAVLHRRCEITAKRRGEEIKAKLRHDCAIMLV